MAPEQLHDEALGRALETLYAEGVTERYRLMAATAAEHLGRAPRFGQLDRPRLHVDGRYHSAEAPDAPVVPLTRGSSRDHRPDVHPVMGELMVEHQAGRPLLMTPLSGHRRDAPDVGAAVRAHMQPWHTTDGLTDLVAVRALDSAANLQQLAQTHLQWMTRVPATVRAAPALLAQADPQILASLTAGSRDHAFPAPDGGREPRWVLIEAARRQAQARRTVDKPWRQHSDQATNAVQPLCRTPVACAADAQQARSPFAPEVQTLAWAASMVRAPPRSSTRGRPGPAARPAQVVSPIDGALASTRTARQALIDQHGCFILAPTALDPTPRPPLALLEGDTGQVQVARGCRFVNDPPVFASSRYLKQPERSMALLRGMTVCLVVYAAVEYRLRQALHDQAATFPDHRGTRIQQPTARWVFHEVVGMHVRWQAGQWPIVLNLTAAHQPLLRLLGQPSMRLDDVRYS